MIDRDDYAVRVIDMPTDVGGFITESPDGFLNIYINARHGHNGQRRSFRHELRHAENEDLHSAEPLAVVEARADGRDPRLESIPKLLRARDLISRPDPKPAPAPTSERPALSAHQARVLAGCLSELDRWYFGERYIR